MRVLHVSDLHISEENEADCRLLVGAMLHDAAKYSEEAPFDLAAFTGDLAGHGKAAEYDLAQEVLLDPLAERLGLSKDRIFLAPGNHDVDRAAIRQMVEIGLVNGLKTPEQVERLLKDGAEVTEAVARLGPWRTFAETRGYAGVEGDPSSITATQRMESDGRSVGVVTLNSAWRCSGADDKGRLLVGGGLAEEALRALSDCDVRIALVHHPLDWLQTFEADQLRAEFESQGFIVLSGHEHSSDPSARKSPRGEAIYLQAGCLYSHLKYPSAYFILDIDPHDRQILVKIRRWSEKTRLFDAATEDAPGGEQSFGLPAGGKFTDLGHPRFSTVKQMIADAAAELRVLPDELSSGESRPVSVEDILIEPRLLSVPFKEAQAMATFTDGVAKQEINAVKELIQKNIVVVSGETQSGVSSTLFWLLSKAYDVDASKMPAYVELSESRIGTAKQAATLAKAASRFGYRAEGGGDPELLLAVDDLNPDRQNKLNRLVKFIQENPHHRFILGCSDSSAPAVSAALDDADLTHSMAYLAPFGKSQLRLLATTVKRGTDADVDQIYGLIRTQSLPQTPFTMLALISVTAGRITDPDDINSTSLLEAFVNLLLGSSEFAEAERLGMNYRKRVALLGELARALYEKPSWTMPIPDVEALFVKFFQDRALRIQATRVLKSLLERQVLRSDGDYVSFRHPALLQLFLGHWMLEEEENKDELLQDPVRNAEAIGHAAALDRNDRDLLIQVAGFVQEAITAVSERLSREQVDKLLLQLAAVDSWGGEHLDKTLAAMPARRSSKELDAEMDRWSEAVDLGHEGLERPGLTSAKDLEKATILLSDVLRQSDLVDDPGLKQEFFELATEGWILLIGLVLAEEHSEGPVRALMEEIIEKLLGDQPLDLKDAIKEIMLWMSTVVIALVAQAKLGARSLASTVEACLSNEAYVESATANCIAVWSEIHLGLPEWPRRLSELLSRLPHETFLRNATVAIAVNKYRSTPDDKAAHEILEELAPHLVTESDARAKKIALFAVKERLGKSRRVFQGGLSVQGSAGAAPELPAPPG
jgi:predicted MPP superfamily phosphohydrolase